MAKLGLCEENEHGSMVAWGWGVDTGIQLEETGVFFFPQAFLILKEIYSDCWKFKN